MNQVLINLDKWIIYKRITCLVPVYLLNTKKEWAKQSRTTNTTVLEFTVGWANMLQRNSSFPHSRLYSHFENTILDQGLLFFEGYEFPTNEFTCPSIHLFFRSCVWQSSAHVIPLFYDEELDEWKDWIRKSILQKHLKQIFSQK